MCSGHQDECESDLDFADRMKPIQEALLNDQVALVVDTIGSAWPLENPEKLLRLEDTEEAYSEIEFEECLKELNLLVKNLYRNEVLVDFLRKVEGRVAVLRVTYVYYYYDVQSSSLGSITGSCLSRRQT
jgi:hypothetical protein